MFGIHFRSDFRLQPHMLLTKSNPFLDLWFETIDMRYFELLSRYLHKKNDVQTWNQPTNTIIRPIKWNVFHRCMTEPIQWEWCNKNISLSPSNMSNIWQMAYSTRSRRSWNWTISLNRSNLIMCITMLSQSSVNAILQCHFISKVYGMWKMHWCR